jgi:hypothetical protein
MTRIRVKGREVATATVVAALGVLAFTAAASAGGQSVPAPPAVPTTADQIQNIDQVKTAIKGYYGNPVASSRLDPVNGTTPLFFATPTSSYANEMAGIEATAADYLSHPYQGKDHDKTKQHGTKAIVLDIDDTTLNTYSYEIYSNFVFNPTSNGAFVNACEPPVNSCVFPAVFGMPQLVHDAQEQGYTIFFLTGRPVSQLTGTKDNLSAAGYPAVPDGQMFLKDLSVPWLASCATTVPACTTDQYKSLTRAHIESMGYDIIANFGDQYSDLSFGHEDRAFKLPNPMYFLP